MTLYVEVAVNIPRITGVFHYHLPEELEGRVVPGCLVTVPFGAQTVQGVVLAFVPEPEVPTTRPVGDLLDSQPALTPAQMALARWMSNENLAPLALCMDAMLPPGLSQQADTLYTRLLPDPLPPEIHPNPLELRLLDLFAKRGSLRGRQIETAFPRQNPRPALQATVRRGWVRSQNVLPPPTVHPKLVRNARLTASPAEIEAALPQLGRAGTPAFQRRRAVLNYLTREPWEVDLPWVYAESGATLPDLQKLADLGLIVLGESEVIRDPLAEMDVPPAEPPELTADQRRVWDALRPALAAAQTAPVPPYLLRGVTGSGKTEIYLRAAAETLRLGRQVLILVPEIALTPQTVRRVLARFPGQVGLIHSRLSPGERYDTWRRIRAGKLPVVVGPRSALFAPLPDVGLIILDECHDASYDQTELPPYFSTVRAAETYARIAHAVCLFGSATPSLPQTYRVERGIWRGLSLPGRILAHQQTVEQQIRRLGLTPSEGTVEGEALLQALPPVEVVDMREELKAGNRSMFSRTLQQALKETLDANQQAILFLNRRGSSTYVFCRSCGITVRCPRCDLPLVHHTHPETLLCHQCGYRRQMPLKCPACGSRALRPLGAGTEKVEAEVQGLFPSARTLRWDADTTREKGAHEIILAHFANHRADILVGTQMLAKGLDLPLVTLVGAVLADVSLNLPDYRSAERTFQLLTQVAGRAGRSPLGGRAIFQTFQPDHYAIQAASHHDYDAFYAREMEYRRRLGYPPYQRLVRLEVRDASSERAQMTAEKLAGEVRGWLRAAEKTATELIGPVPCYFSRVGGVYRWQIILRGPDPVPALRGKDLPEHVRVEIDPPSLL